MKKLGKYINLSELFLSIFLVISITFSVVFSLYLVNDRDELYEMTEITINDSRYDRNISFGEYEIRNYKHRHYYGYNYGYSFQVKSGEDFYNNVIKTNEHYDSNLVFEDSYYDIFGYMWDGFDLITYNIDTFLVNIYYINPNNALCPVLSSYVYTEEDIEKYVNEELEWYKKDNKNYTEDDLNKERERIKKAYSSPSINLSFDEMKKIYNDSNSEYYEVSDDCILVKTKYSKNNAYVLSKNYFVKIVNDNGEARIYKIKDTQEFLELELQQ